MTAQWAVRTAKGLRPEAKASPSAPAKQKGTCESKCLFAVKSTLRVGEIAFGG